MSQFPSYHPLTIVKSPDWHERVREVASAKIIAQLEAVQKKTLSDDSSILRSTGAIKVNPLPVHDGRHAWFGLKTVDVPISNNGSPLPTVDMYKNFLEGSYHKLPLMTFGCFASLASSHPSTLTLFPRVLHTTDFLAAKELDRYPLIAGRLDVDDMNKLTEYGDHVVVIPMAPLHFINYFLYLKKAAEFFNVNWIIDGDNLHQYVVSHWGLYGPSLQLKCIGFREYDLSTSVFNPKYFDELVTILVRPIVGGDVSQTVSNLLDGVRLPMLAIYTATAGVLETYFHKGTVLEYPVNNFYSSTDEHKLPPSAYQFTPINRRIITNVIPDALTCFVVKGYVADPRHQRDFSYCPLNLIDEQDKVLLEVEKAADLMIYKTYYQMIRKTGDHQLTKAEKSKAWRRFNIFLSSARKNIVVDGRVLVGNKLGYQNTHLKFAEMCVLGLIPKTKCGAHLDLCSGEGGFIQAAHDLGYVKHYSMDSDGSLEKRLSGLLSSSQLHLHPIKRFDLSVLNDTNDPFQQYNLVVGLFIGKAGNFFVELENFMKHIPHDFGLVTCDGYVKSSEEYDYESMWRVQRPLFLFQIITAFMTVGIGGTIVIKYFYRFPHHVMCLIAEIASHFRRVSFVKPPSSHPMNFERYLVMNEFVGESYAFDQSDWQVPPSDPPVLRYDDLNVLKIRCYPNRGVITGYGRARYALECRNFRRFLGLLYVTTYGDRNPNRKAVDRLSAGFDHTLRDIRNQVICASVEEYGSYLKAEHRSLNKKT